MFMHTLQRVMRKTGAALTACLMASLLPAIPVQAESEQRLVGYYGDVNGDNRLDSADIHIMSEWLDGSIGDAESLSGLRMEYADLDHNGRINAVDLSVAKRICLTNGNPEPVYEIYETAPLIESVAAKMNATLPSTGDVRIPVFVVSFPDCQFPDSIADPAKEIERIMFGDADASSPYYPLESVTAFYDRASYGRMHIEGDVYRYDAEDALSVFSGNPSYLFDIILWAFQEQLDFSQYDRDGDGAIDGMIAVLPEDSLNIDADGDNVKDWWPSTNRSAGAYTVDGVHVGKYCVGGQKLSDIADFNSSWVHELGHTMGLPDYYKYRIDEVDLSRTQYGLNGNAGWEMMDDAWGDFSSFSKLMLGWMAENEVQTYTGGTQTFRLDCAQQHPSCILIPRNPEDGLLGEFFLVEYILPESNYSPFTIFGKKQTLFKNGGVRVLHCDSHAVRNMAGMEFKWHNYSKYYDNSNLKQRILRLVNEQEGGGLFDFGTMVDSRISGFHWYDDAGYQTVDPQVTIQLGSLQPGASYDPNANPWEWAQSSGRYSDEYLRDSWVSVTISDGS